jgi:diphosphomevalonate decarboxylase
MPSTRPASLAATSEASPNIALVKYWGMRDEPRGLPFNSSLSLTLGGIFTRTSVRFDPLYPEDRLVLNGEAQYGAPLEAVSTFLDTIRERSGRTERASVRSRNNFPTASGLASSASGFAALAAAASAAARLALSPRALSQLARLGSGSASRSVFGGFVEWRAGQRPDGSDCYARPLFGPRHWPRLRDLVVVVRGASEKQVRSARAMQTTVATSPFYAERLAAVPRRLATIRSALRARDPERLFPMIMEECDDFRQVCETTSPSLDYLTPVSRAVLGEVRSVNREEGRFVAAYTHDAGAHVHVFAIHPDVGRVRRRLARLPGVIRVLELSAGPGVRASARPVR